MIQCVSLCEILMSLEPDENAIDNEIKQLCKMHGINELARIYIGSNFCPKYFLYCEENVVSLIIDWCEKNNKKITLCLPVFSERDLIAGKNRLSKYEKWFKCGIIDEITVNDLGMLAYVAERYPYININLGRLFNKDTRDQRYPEFIGKTCVPDLLTLKNAVAFDYRVHGIEFDSTHATLDLTGTDLQVAVYFPYCYATLGSICEFASIAKPINKKFRTNAACSMQCMEKYAKYQTEYSNFSYVKFGRAVYFKVSGATVKSSGDFRMIYDAIDYFMQKD